MSIGTAAAPKVASDTGAGLREALRAIEQHINDFAGCDDSPSGDEVESDARKGLAYLRQHLAATPTDATDGATGGGEVLERACERSWDVTHRVLWRHASEQQRADWAVGIRAALATTPGGDLLEQAPPTPNKDEAR